MEKVCVEKCIVPPHAFREPQLGKGEGVCIERCVSKFLQASAIARDICNKEPTDATVI
eukprot:Pgem_evm1s2209